MNYQLIHDNIIVNAKNRTPDPKTYYERHHIVPKMEGGLMSGETVRLTQKEHRLIHLLRHKITGLTLHLGAAAMIVGDRQRAASAAAKRSHEVFRERNPDGYFARQRRAGQVAGANSLENKLGFFSLSPLQMKEAQDKGRKTLVREKIGMFSDEYRLSHKSKMQKKVLIDDVLFNSCGEAAEHYQVVAGSISYWIKTGKAKIIEVGEYSYMGKEQNNG